MQSLVSNKCDLFSRKLEGFNEMKIEINVINNKIFTKLYLKIGVRGKQISYYNENMLFLRKTDETIWKSPLSKRTPPFQPTPYF